MLVVEDDYFVALDLEANLTEAGLGVVGVATNAQQAIELARSERPDIIVMDIRLHGEADGVDAAIEIFRETGVRCIFATAHQDAPTKARAAPAEPIAWVAKPYATEALVALVRDALNRARRAH